MRGQINLFVFFFVFPVGYTIADKDQAMEHYIPRTVVRGTR